ncbi:hypothetical protein GF358_01255 [Candidatus Woesearchaeota archaeon]|nr:hypothetical protein [Candidatus Woesearchaeota archaeon]
MLRKLIFGLFFMILISSIANAAEIRGRIYDFELNTIDNARVEIDTVPKQVLVASDGEYSFSLPLGIYTITATYPPEDLKIKESVTIEEHGAYTLDLILLPNLEAEEEILSEASDINITKTFVEEDVNTLGRLGFAAGLVSIIVLIFFMWYKFKSKTEELRKEVDKTAKKVKEKQKPVLDKDLNELYTFIKKEGGRTTQKDIRKNFPKSEAKVSLMITELEDKGVIKRIKKGRGNIIVLS